MRHKEAAPAIDGTGMENPFRTILPLKRRRGPFVPGAPGQSLDLTLRYASGLDERFDT